MILKVNQMIFVTLALFLPACQFQGLNKGCKRNDINFNECVVKAINSVRSKLKKGWPELKLASFDPMFVPRIQITQGSGPVIIDSILTNQKFYGITNYEVTNAIVDLDDYTMTFDVSLPYLFVEGDYKIEGKILILPIEGSGDSWSNYTQMDATGVLKGHPVTRGGKEYFSLDDIKFNLKVEKGVINMNNLFNGNQELGDAMNKFMSENWELMFQELKPAVEQVIEVLCKDIAVKVFNRYSLDDMFPK